MAKQKFEASRQHGVHRQLDALVGEWEGITRTWFEPDVLSDESAMSGTIRSVLEGRFVVYEYAGSLSGKPFTGIMICGFDLASEKLQAAWIDSFHMSTGIMFSEGSADGSRLSFLGSYGSNEERWGWRTVIFLEDVNRLIITAYNISPAGEESKGVETVYMRKS